MNLSFTRIPLVVVAAAVALLVVTCGTDVGSGGASAPESGHTWPPSEVQITREEAIEIVLENCTGNGPRTSEFTGGHSPVVRLMTANEWAGREGGKNYGPDAEDWHWIVQIEGSGNSNQAKVGSSETTKPLESPLFRYKACAIEADSGKLRETSSRLSPALIPVGLQALKVGDQTSRDGAVVEYASGSPEVSRDDLIELIRERYPDGHHLDRLEIDLVRYTAPPRQLPPTPTPGSEPSERATARGSVRTQSSGAN